ncbi:unnamed protein product [Mytilus coruscus]|uniref:Uncharacterized protein n=1 Tax=Mytilus coruscus TaxID=42192 RepID=A0A6J8BY40_MYTCO|nr:unnamed protein product [Mytilus coruscus]
MIYRNGTDIFGCLHTIVVENLKCIDDNKRLKKESIIQAEKMASTVSAESRKNKQEQSLEDANSQCVQPLHLLYTDIADKFSNSSSTFLSINARLGAGISKDSLRRYITNRCRELEQKQRYILSDSFIVASFDNLDKNQAYSVVCAGKDRSGFHGTTIQTVVPKPSQKINMFDDSNLISNLNQTNIEHDISEVKNSRDRKLEKNIIQKLVNPEDKFGLPPVKKQNKFSNMSPSDLDETSAEISEWDEFYTSVTKYGFSKNFFKKENIVLPGIKTFFSIPVETTEKSDFSSVAILDETADSKETVLKVLNILNDKFQVGQLTNYVVVVGDGKSYDHLIKLKSEYGENMDWQLATKHHHGATLKVLTECSKFAITHRCFIQAWEAVMRHQVKSFFEYKSCESPYDIQVSGLMLDIISDMSLDEGEDDVCKTDVWEKVCEKKKEIFTFFTDDLLEEYNTWRHENSSVNQTFAFWDNFVHLDFMAYLGLFFSIRSRNWHLRNVSLKKITCLFHAFDRQNYQRLIPYHLADLHTFPEPVIKHFAAGCFSVSISGKHLYSVGLDEAHEMEINLKSKNALNSFSQSSLANLTFYLPYRAKTLHNLKSELQLERERRTETDHEQTDSLINYRKYGEEDLGNYLKCFLFRTCETAGKPPPRKRRNLKTFAPIKITIHKQKKEIKDQNTVISCLRKKIAFSKHSGNAVKDLDQFLQLPRALCDAEGIPEKGQKATAANVFKNIYSDAFLLQVPKAPVSSKTTVIIDAGGFDDDRKNKAISILNGQVVDYDLASCNHEEADTRVWIYASVTTADQVIIYSPDTDVFFIAIREKLWERVVTEVEMMPNHEALKLHWMRCCWVFDYWSQSTSNTHTLSELSKSGWQITDNRLEIVWDTVLNFQKVEKTVEWYTKGCGYETEDLEDPVEDEQPEVDGLVENLIKQMITGFSISKWEYRDIGLSQDSPQIVNEHCNQK